MLILYFWLLFIVIHAQFITVQKSDATFRLNNKQYRSLGTTLYPFWSGSSDYSKRIMMQGLANGFTSFRAVLIFEQLNGKTSTSALWSDLIWVPVDQVLANARSLGVHVTLELSGLANWMQSINMDPYNSTNYPRKLLLFILVWDQLVDFVTQRVNSVNGILYSQDEFIYCYTVLGEVIPSPRSVQAPIFALLKRVAARLKSKDPNHLVGSGGLLHMSTYSGYNDPYLYWQVIYGDPNVDICMQHIYQDPTNVLKNGATSEWTLLPTYTSYCRGLGKPFAVDEFGLNLDNYPRSTALAYFNFAFQKALVANVSVIEIWNWKSGDTFDLFPQEEILLMQIIRKYSKSWGYLGQPFYQVNATQDLTNMQSLLTFDQVNQVQGIVASAPLIQTNLKGSLGTTGSAQLSFSFGTTNYDQETVYFPSSLFSTQKDWSAFASVSNAQLYCDVYIDSTYPTMPTGYNIRYQITGSSGKVYSQQAKSIWNNYIMLYQWNRVYLYLDYNLHYSEFGHSMTLSGWQQELSAVQGFQLALIHQPGQSSLNGKLWIDSCSIGVSSEQMIEETNCDATQYVTVQQTTQQIVVKQQYSYVQSFLEAPNAAPSSDNNQNTEQNAGPFPFLFYAGLGLNLLGFLLLSHALIRILIKNRGKPLATNSTDSFINSKETISASNDEIH